MVLTDREAADIKADQAEGLAQQTMTRTMQANRGNIAIAFRNGLRETVDELSARLIDLYAQLDGADDHMQDALVAEVTRRVTSFITAQQAGQRGSHVAETARVAADAIGKVETGTRTSFKLAVYEHMKRQAAAPVPSALTAPVRRMQDKFGILYSPSEYEADFKRSVGALGVSVIFFDVDNFKKVNDQFTEPVIDRTLLRELMEMIRGLADGRGFAYAEGGDEFVITLPNTSTALAEPFTVLLLERIRTATFDVDGALVKITASAGIASTMNPDDGQRSREAASAAKRDAKRAGRDRYEISVVCT